MEVDQAKEILLAYDAGNLLPVDSHAVATTVYAGNIASAIALLEKEAKSGCETSIKTLALMLDSESEEALEVLRESRDEVVCNAYDLLGTGYVYALVNQYMPHLFKIGYTTASPKERAKQISSGTGVPTEFIVLFSFRTMMCQDVEADIHRILDSYRVNQGREFFRCEPQVALDAFEKAIKKTHVQAGFTEDQSVFKGVTEFYADIELAKCAALALKNNPAAIFDPRNEGSPF